MRNFASYRWAQITFAKEKAEETTAINGKDICPNVSQSTLPCLNFPYLILISVTMDAKKFGQGTCCN